MLKGLAWSAAVAVAVAGCGAATNTLAQDLAWERWKQCENQLGPRVTLHSIRRDGQIYINHFTGGEMDAANECLRKAAIAQAGRSVTTAPPAATAPSGPASNFSQPPVLKPGSEWAFRWESPRGKGTFVYVLDREEIREGSTWYVVKSSTRELYYRKQDLAISLDVVSGATDIRRSPPMELLKWPLTAGREWEQTYTVERPQERTSNEISAICKIEREETITVPAGSFPTFKSVCRNRRTGGMIFELWYSEQAAWFIRERTEFSYGIRERELISYRLR